MRHRADLAVPDAPEEDAGPPTPPRVASARVRVGIGAAVALVIAAAVVAVLLSATAQQGSSMVLASSGTVSTDGAALPSGAASESSAPSGQLLVHVTGAVREPGLVSLTAGSRVVDAVAAAGGLTEEADPAALNLARPVADGEQLVVLRVGEAPPPAAVAGGSGSGGSGAAGGAGGGSVNLNTASQAELETLPRIGPALAQRILDWRQSNGRFSDPKDLLKVSGIGQKLFDGLKDKVTV